MTRRGRPPKHSEPASDSVCATPRTTRRRRRLPSDDAAVARLRNAVNGDLGTEIDFPRAAPLTEAQAHHLLFDAAPSAVPWTQRFAETLAVTGSVALAARAAGRSLQTCKLHRKTDAAFARAWDEAVELACDALEQECRRRAYYKSDDLIKFLLSALKPDVYGKKTEISFKHLDVKNWTDAQLDAALAGVPIPQVLAMRGEQPALPAPADAVVTAEEETPA